MGALSQQSGLAAHRATHAVAGEQTTIGKELRYRPPRSEWCSRPGRGPPRGDRHAQCAEGEFPGDPLIHRPAHDTTGEHVEDDREIKPTLGGRNIRDVRQPDTIRADAVNRRPRRLEPAGNRGCYPWSDRNAASGGHKCRGGASTSPPDCARSVVPQRGAQHALEGCRSDLCYRHARDGFPRSTGDWRPFACFPVAFSTRSSRWH